MAAAAGHAGRWAVTVGGAGLERRARLGGNQAGGAREAEREQQRDDGECEAAHAGSVARPRVSRCTLA